MEHAVRHSHATTQQPLAPPSQRISLDPDHTTMHLNYLDFDYSEDGDGTGTFDAMASVTTAQLPALMAEISTVLTWAHQQWPDACRPLEEGGEWQCDLHGVQEVSTPLALEFDALCGQLRCVAEDAATARTILTLTLSGRSAFCAAVRDAFDIA